MLRKIELRRKVRVCSAALRAIELPSEQIRHALEIALAGQNHADEVVLVEDSNLNAYPGGWRSQLFYMERQTLAEVPLEGTAPYTGCTPTRVRAPLRAA
jgi:hypothetical protein